MTLTSGFMGFKHRSKMSYALIPHNRGAYEAEDESFGLEACHDLWKGLTSKDFREMISMQTGLHLKPSEKIGQVTGYTPISSLCTLGWFLAKDP
jgi:hypothetical protein